MRVLLYLDVTRISGITAFSRKNTRSLEKNVLDKLNAAAAPTSCMAGSAHTRQSSSSVVDNLSYSSIRNCATKAYNHFCPSHLIPDFTAHENHPQFIIDALKISEIFLIEDGNLIMRDMVKRISL